MSDEIKQLVTLLSAQVSTDVPKRGGGTYPGALLVYTCGGKPGQKGVHKAVLSDHVKDKISKLEGKSGIDLTLHMRKNDKDYWDLLDILPPEAAVKGKVAGTGGGSSFKKSTRGGQAMKSTKDVARVARQTALQAAVIASADATEALKVAEAFTTFILAPLGVDSLGEELTTTGAVVENATTGGTDEELPF